MPPQLPCPSCVCCSRSRPCSPRTLGPSPAPAAGDWRGRAEGCGRALRCAGTGAGSVAVPDIAAGAEQVPPARPAPRAALSELFVCLFITQVFLKK